MHVEKILKFVRSNLNIIIPLLLLIPIYAILYKIYIPRVNAFGCFDDCNNFMGGYFLLQGKAMFSEFFFNHQPFAGFISYFIQAVTHPQNVFELILRHRQFVLVFSLIMNAILIWRFRLPAFLFILLYEPAKFYLFGDRFLAEGIIVYPLAYLTGLALLKISSQKPTANSQTLLTIDYYLVSIAAWFVIFMREPYVPLALVLFAIIFFENKLRKIRIIPILLFATLSIITLLSFNLSEYFFNVVTVNYTAVLPSDVKADMLGNRFTQALFYPVYVFFYGNSNILRNLLILIDIVLLANLFVLFKKRVYRTIIAILIVLGLANIRVVLPGSMFYEAFHLLVWFALFVFITSMLVFWNFIQKKLFYASILILSFALLSFVSSRSYFAHEPFDQHKELLTNYGEVMQIGEVARKLSGPGDTLFLDGSDDLIYWQAKIPSSYKYSWYTSAMPHFKKYADARIEMFKINPPTFYKEFGSCPKKSDIGELYRLPDFVKNKYVQLYNLENPSCLFVRKDKVDQISDAQWKKAAESLYRLPRTTIP